MTIAIQIIHAAQSSDFTIGVVGEELNYILKPGEAVKMHVWGNRELELKVAGEHTSEVTIVHSGDHGHIRLAMISPAGLATDAESVTIETNIGPGESMTRELWPKWTLKISEASPITGG